MSGLVQRPPGTDQWIVSGTQPLFLSDLEQAQNLQVDHGGLLPCSPLGLELDLGTGLVLLLGDLVALG